MKILSTGCKKGVACLQKNELFLLLCHGTIYRRLIATRFVAPGSLFTAGFITIREPFVAPRFVVIMPVHMAAAPGN